MSKSGTTNIVRMDWLRNRTPTGRRSATGARKLAMYLVTAAAARPSRSSERSEVSG